MIVSFAWFQIGAFYGGAKAEVENMSKPIPYSEIINGSRVDHYNKFLLEQCLLREQEHGY